MNRMLGDDMLAALITSPARPLIVVGVTLACSLPTVPPTCSRGAMSACADRCSDGRYPRGAVSVGVAKLGMTIVVAGAAVEDVLAAVADQDVVAAPPVERVVAGAADQDVVAVAAVGRELDRRPQARRVHHVVAAQGVDDQPVVGGLGAGDVDLGGQTDDGDAARVAGDRDHVVAGGAVDDDGVGLAVADAAARRRRQVDVDLGHVGAGQVVDGDGVGAAQGVEVDRPRRRSGPS